MACALFWALQIVFINRVGVGTGRPIMLCLVQYLVCAVLGLVAAAGTEHIAWYGMLGSAPEILFAGVISSGIGFTLQAVGQRFTTAPQAAIMLSSEALFAALFGAIILGERMSVSGIAGCALIFTAMIAVEAVPGLIRRDAVRP